LEKNDDLSENKRENIEYLARNNYENKLFMSPEKSCKSYNTYENEEINVKIKLNQTNSQFGGKYYINLSLYLSLSLDSNDKKLIYGKKLNNELKSNFFNTLEDMDKPSIMKLKRKPTLAARSELALLKSKTRNDFKIHSSLSELNDIKFFHRKYVTEYSSNY